MNRYRSILLLVFCLFIQGCITQGARTGRNINPDEIPDMNRQAILFGVLSKQGGGNNASLFIQQSDRNHAIRLQALSFLRGVKEIDKPGQEGRLFAISVEPGEYYVSGWQLEIHKGGKHHASFTSPAGKTTSPFRAAAGDIIYLGSFNAKAATKRNHFNLPVVNGAELDVNRQLKRDKAFLLSKYPALSTGNMIDYSALSMRWDGQLAQRQN